MTDTITIRREVVEAAILTIVDLEYPLYTESSLRMARESKQALRAALAAPAPTVEPLTDYSDLHDMVRWAYSKLHRQNYTKQEDALMLDAMKLLLEHGIGGAA